MAVNWGGAGAWRGDQALLSIARCLAGVNPKRKGALKFQIVKSSCIYIQFYIFINMQC